MVFAALGALAGPYPELLGNGEGAAQIAFAGVLSGSLAASLTALKPTATAACLGSGAVGGLLTPSLATGAAVTARALPGHSWPPGRGPGG